MLSCFFIFFLGGGGSCKKCYAIKRGYQIKRYRLFHRGWEGWVGQNAQFFRYALIERPKNQQKKH